MRAKFVNESEELRIPLKDLTFDVLEPNMSGQYSKRFLVPSDFMSSRELHNQQDFDWWYPEFIKRYGDEGDIVITNGRAELVGNSEFDRMSDVGGAAVSKYYRDKPPGGFTGD